MERRLAAILAADVVGYSRLMSKDEASTLAALKACEIDVIEPTVKQHTGRIFKRMGDGYLAEFASAVDLVECAMSWQKQILSREDQPLCFRIGANVGEVVVDGDDLYGDDVNIAARMEALAQPACIALSESAFRQVCDRVNAEFDDLGQQDIKGIPRPVRVWEWRGIRTLPPRLQNARPRVPDKPSIIVLPVRNLSGDREQDFLAEGLRIDIQNALTQVSGVFVIAHATASALEGATPTNASLSTGARHILQASLRTAGKRIRVAVELVDGIENRVIWSERYDRTLDDSFELQDEITERILTGINVTLVAGEQAKVWHRTVKPLKALELFYKGVHAFLAMEREDIVRARQLFMRVAEMCPGSSAGPTWVALTHWVDVQRGWSESPEESKALARKFAEEADAMEYSDGQAQTVLSHVYLMDGAHDAALAAGRRAVTNRPACANANGFFANVLHYCGAYEDAIRHMDLAMRFQPLHPPFFRNVLAASYLAKCLPDRASEFAQQALAIAPKDVFARLIMTSANVRDGRPEMAHKLVAEVKEIDPSFSVKRFFETQYYRDESFLKDFSADLLESGLAD
ncbi:MAG: adenylate/guanylate cyclase domain-containing protein [Hyphomicrobiaceae bacterium]